MIVFGQNCFYCGSNMMYSIKVVVFGKKWLLSSNMVVFGRK